MHISKSTNYYLFVKPWAFLVLTKTKPCTFALNKEQINLLERQHCKSDNWEKIHFHPEQDLSRIENVLFSGEVTVDLIEGDYISEGGFKRRRGLFNSNIHECKIGKNVFINQVKNYIANYNIGNEVIIDNVDLIAVTDHSTFGNGIKVKTINEGGGREVTIFDELTSQLAYVMALYRHKNEAIKNIESMIQEYTSKIKNNKGFIGENSVITNTRTIKNVKIGAFTKITGASKLINGSINSSEQGPVFIGCEVMADNFIICSDSIVDNSTVIDNCFVGQGCVLDKHYSAEQSLFFANSQGFNGEACSIFAGPYTVTHHKSTLLIAGMFSFMNAGSGSNQSNHMYKLGPIHQGVLQRGAKTTSNSYILWPSKVGVFTLVSGRHYQNVDSSEFPFSYLLESKDETYLVPAINLKTVGTLRDAQKWKKRDRRKGEKKLDLINYNLLSPFTIHKVTLGLNALKKDQRAIWFTHQRVQLPRDED